MWPTKSDTREPHRLPEPVTSELSAKIARYIDQILPPGFPTPFFQAGQATWTPRLQPSIRIFTLSFHFISYALWPLTIIETTRLNVFTSRSLCTIAGLLTLLFNDVQSSTYLTTTLGPDGRFLASFFSFIHPTYVTTWRLVRVNSRRWHYKYIYRYASLPTLMLS